MSHVAHKQNRSTYVAKAKQKPTKSFFFLASSCGEKCSPRYRHTSMCRRPSRPCHHSANDVLCGPIPVNKLSSQKTRLPIYRLSSSRFRLSYSKVRQKAFSDFVQFRHTQSLLHMWDELTANISMNPFRAA